MHWRDPGDDLAEQSTAGVGEMGLQLERRVSRRPGRTPGFAANSREYPDLGDQQTWTWIASCARAAFALVCR